MVCCLIKVPAMRNQSCELAQLHLVGFVPVRHKEEITEPPEDEQEAGKAEQEYLKSI